MGTLFKRIAPALDVADVDDVLGVGCGFGELKAEESASSAQGEGKGLRGEIMEADVDSEGR